MLLRPDYPLETERMLLRPYEPGDIEAVLDLHGRDDVTAFLPWGAVSREGAEEMLERRVRMTGLGIDDRGGSIVLAATLKDGGAFVGEFALHLADAASRQGEVGWVVHPDRQGTGLATEGARRMLEIAFLDLALHRVSADCGPRNAASTRVMERLGMRREAHLREDLWLKGVWVDELVYAILRAEWEAARA